MRRVNREGAQAMACNSCESSGRFRASYCDDCERWTFHVDKRDLLIAAGVVAVAAVIILQPELLAPAGLLMARRAFTALV
jgi:hypothetical protein